MTDPNRITNPPDTWIDWDEETWHDHDAEVTGLYLAAVIGAGLLVVGLAVMTVVEWFR